MIRVVANRWPGLQARLSLAAFVLTVAPTAALTEINDAEIKPFHLTSFGGDLSIRYSLDNREQSTAGTTSGFVDQSGLETELSLLGNGYVYHPDFLEWTFGGGPLLVTRQFSSTGGDNDDNEVLFNFLGDFRFLQEKPYPVNLYFSRSHPTFTTSLSGRFLVQRDEAGFKALVREPVLPVQLTLDAFIQDSDGSGLGAVLDERVEEASASLFKGYRESDRISLTYRDNRRDSSSGSAGLPISDTRIHTRAADVDARNAFGADGQIIWVQQFNEVRQDTELESGLDELHNRAYFTNLNWTHTGRTRSFYNYRFRDSTRGDRARSRIQSATAGIVNRFGDYTRVTGDLNGERDEDLAFERRVSGARLRINHTRPVGSGNLSLGGGWQLQRISQVADSSQVQVIDEPLVLEGTTPIDLANDFVVEGSVIVRNEPKTQVFVQGIDYRLILVGSTTSIQRLVGGNIVDGQTVLVEYAYLSGGSADFDAMSQNYIVDFRFLKHFNVYARFSDRTYDVVGGSPTIPLNEVQNITLGFGVDYPLGNRFVVGGEVMLTDQTEDIASYQRESYDLYLRVSLPLTTGLTLSGHSETVDNEGSPEDVDLRQLRMQLRSRPWRGILLSASADWLKDTGGTLLRERESWGAGIEWSYRKMRLLIRGDDVSEQLGTTRRSFLQVTAHVVRMY